MYTSDNNSENRTVRTFKICLFYVIATIFFALFGAVYEIFSHEVYSYFMLFAFAIPLLLGLLPFVILGISKKRLSKPYTAQLYGGGVMMLTAGCVMKGVLDIYGTTNWKLLLFLIIGITAIVASFLMYILEKRTISQLGS